MFKEKFTFIGAMLLYAAEIIAILTIVMAGLIVKGDFKSENLTVLGAIVFYVCNVVAIATIAVCGVMIGRKLRDRKMRKLEKEAGNE